MQFENVHNILFFFLQGCFKIRSNVTQTEEQVNAAPVYVVYMMAITITYMYITWEIMHNKLSI